MKYILIFILLFPFSVAAQKSNVTELNIQSVRTSKTANGWIGLDSGWKFKTGDNPEWANPNFNDSSWQSTHLFSGGDTLASITKNGITWFRLKIKNDSTFSQPLIMRVYQTGASEIYLDGKLIHQLGKVSSNPDSVVYFNSGIKNLSFPLLNESVQTLAIRFANVHRRFPIYFSSSGSSLEPWVTTFENGRNDYIVQYFKRQNKLEHIAMGVTILLCVLFFSFFLFFPAQKVNLYFALSNFSFLLFLILSLFSTSYEGDPSLIFRIGWLFIYLYILLNLFCIYKIFHKKLEWAFWALIVAACVDFLGSFFVNTYLSTFLLLLVLVDSLRICVSSLKTNKAGASILLVFIVIVFVFWIFELLSEYSIINIPDIRLYEPLMYLVTPLGLAIYLGYDFGKVSQSLRRKLVEVEHLSVEKQQILTEQNITLEKQVKERTSVLNRTLENLKSTNNLLQQQKEETEEQKKYVEKQNEIIQAENERKSQELEEARQMQLSMLPKELPQLPHLEIAVYMKTATEVGGDYYDFSTMEDGSLNICLGDATGHGMKAGIMVSSMKSIFTTNASKMKIEHFIRTANSGIKSMNLKRMMMGLVMLNINKTRFKLINAGMPPVFLFKQKTKTIQEIKEHGMPVGAMSLSSYTILDGVLEKGDVLLLLSDGMPELQNSSEEMYGYERLTQCFAEIAEKTPQEIVNHLANVAVEWTDGNDPDDDVTFVVVKVK